MKGTQICQNLITIFFNAFIDPMFECVSENVLETWQKNNHTFKKTEYTMKLEVNVMIFFEQGVGTSYVFKGWRICVCIFQLGDS